MTEEEKIKLLSDTSLTNNFVQKQLNCSGTTVSRYRKKYGICHPRGLKPGQHNNKIKKTNKHCKICNNIFQITPSTDKIYCSRKCMYGDNDYILKLKNMNKSYMQTEKYRKSLMKPDTPAYRRYRNRVGKLTEKIYKQNEEIINPNKLKRTLCGIDGGHQLDHKISVRTAFNLGWRPEEVADLNNLQMLPWKTNLLKR